MKKHDLWPIVSAKLKILTYYIISDVVDISSDVVVMS